MMNKNKQCSVEWVIENLTLIHALLSRREIGVEFFNRKYNEIVEQGKTMHEKEIKDAVGIGSQFDRDYLYGYHDKAEQYYNETFGGNKW